MKPLVTFLLLAKQCGAEVDDSLLHRTLVHFFRYAGRGLNPYGDDRYYNNLFVRLGDLTLYDSAPLPATLDGNVYLGGAKPPAREKDPIVRPDFDPGLRLEEAPDGVGEPSTT